MKSENTDTPQGLAFAITAYVLWGFLPLYLKLLSHLSPAEVLAHRVLWSVPVAGVFLVFMGRTKQLLQALRTPLSLMMGAITALLVSCNWGIYVWAIGAGHTIDAALGYYINPLFSVALGALLLGERLNRAQMAAIGLAGLAVVILTIQAGSLPWVAVGLMLSWGFYAYFKKSLPIGPNQGFMLEVLLLTPFAIGYLGYLTITGESHFALSWRDTFLLMGCGVVTAVPLMIYANGAKLLRLTTIGILQYIAPTMIFLTAVFIFGEEFDRARQIAFPLIWASLVIYSFSLVRTMRLQH